MPDCFAMMRRDIVANDMDRRDGRRNLRLHRGEEGEKLALAFPAVALSIDVAGPGIKGGAQVQRAIPSRLMLDAVGEPRLGWLRGVEVRPGLQRGLFIEAEDDLIRPKRTGVERDERGHLLIEGRIARMFWRQPQMMAPWFELVMGEKPTDRGRRDSLGDASLDEGTRQCGAIPWGETPSAQLRSFAGQLDEMDSDLGGKRPGDAPVGLGRPGHGGPVGGSV
jgi:hypothetical protein